MFSMSWSKTQTRFEMEMSLSPWSVVVNCLGKLNTALGLCKDGRIQMFSDPVDR